MPVVDNIAADLLVAQTPNAIASVRPHTNSVVFNAFRISSVFVILLYILILQYGDTRQVRFLTNSNGDICGDAGYKLHKYLYHLEYYKCIQLGKYMSTYGCPVHSVCVPKCFNTEEAKVYKEDYNCARTKIKKFCYSRLVETFASRQICFRQHLDPFTEYNISKSKKEFSEAAIPGWDSTNKYYKRYLDETRWRYNVIIAMKTHFFMVAIICILVTLIVYGLTLLYIQWPKVMIIVIGLMYIALFALIIAYICWNIPQIDDGSVHEFVAFRNLEEYFQQQKYWLFIFMFILIALLINMICCVFHMISKSSPTFNVLRLSSKLLFGLKNLVIFPCFLMTVSLVMLLLLWFVYYNLTSFTNKVFVNLKSTKLRDGLPYVADNSHVILKKSKADFTCSPDTDENCFFYKYELSIVAIIYGVIAIVFTLLWNAFLIDFTRALCAGVLIFWYKQPKTLVEFQDNMLMGVFGRILTYHVGNIVMGVLLEPAYQLSRIPHRFALMQGIGIFNKQISMCANLVTMYYGSEYLISVRYAHSLSFRRKEIINTEGTADGIFYHLRVIGVYITLIIVYWALYLVQPDADRVAIAIIISVCCYLLSGILQAGAFGAIYAVPFLLRNEIEQNSGKLISKQGMQMYKEIFPDRSF